MRREGAFSPPPNNLDRAPPAIFFLMTRPPPTSTLFPSSTLFHSAPPTSRRRRETTRYPGSTTHSATTSRWPATVSERVRDRKSTRLNSSHSQISYAVFCLKKKNTASNSTKHTSPHLIAWRNIISLIT